ncbi:stress response protein nst1-like [Aristolochia californica]|uniref:stress response protein nst1-like n=1 Tax=Aristolochia californica TaxID=171875 RepID=UPI0035DB92D7
MIPGIGGGMLGLDMPVHQSQHHPQMIPFASSDHHSQEPQKQHGYGYMGKGKAAPGTDLSDEDDQVFGDEAVAVDGSGKRVSPWHRMKWTDSMVRLLIMVVYYVGGDDWGGACGGGDGPDKKKGGGGGLLQKKGKWKSMSRAMMEKGFYVSPQQCEDKFNDLNKRYKRVNDILGKGTACRVVENQSLLDTLDHISPKTKEEVRKLLNSKHLFFREMCAYHSSCANNSAAVAHNQSESVGVTLDSSLQHQQPPQRCSHEANGEKDVGKASGGYHYEEEEGDDDEDEDEDDDDDDEGDDDMEEQTEHGHQGDEKGGRKRFMKRKRSPLMEQSSSSSPVQQLRNELMRMAEDGSKILCEQKDWIRKRTVELEEQRASYQLEALELEKQRFKWLKFSGKKERELERLKLDNERRRLENDRMVLLLRHKDLELELRAKRPEPPSLTGGS